MSKTELEEKEKQALMWVVQADLSVAQAHRPVHIYQEIVRAKRPEKLQNLITDQPVRS